MTHSLRNNAASVINSDANMAEKQPKFSSCNFFLAHIIYRVPTLVVKKNSRTFPRFSRPPKAFFQDLDVSQQCLNIATNSS